MLPPHLKQSMVLEQVGIDRVNVVVFVAVANDLKRFEYARPFNRIEGQLMNPSRRVRRNSTTSFEHLTPQARMVTVDTDVELSVVFTRRGGSFWGGCNETHSLETSHVAAKLAIPWSKELPRLLRRAHGPISGRQWVSPNFGATLATCSIPF